MMLIFSYEIFGLPPVIRVISNLGDLNSQKGDCYSVLLLYSCVRKCCTYYEGEGFQLFNYLLLVVLHLTFQDSHSYSYMRINLLQRRENCSSIAGRLCAVIKLVVVVVIGSGEEEINL